MERYPGIIALVLVLIATIRVVSTYSVLSHTFDEPDHIACGMEWLDRHTYTYETQHPPLARVAAAIGPYLLGIRSQRRERLDKEATAVIYDHHQYDRTLTAARLGILPFFWIACLVTYQWARRAFDARVAVGAVFFFSFLPPVLAHAGLATTDMALTALLGAAFFSSLIFVEDPSPAHGALFGACTALAVLSKFSALAFLPVTWIIALAFYVFAERPKFREFAAGVRRLLPALALAVLIAVVMIWGAYRFSYGDAGFAGLRLPAPELFRGIQVVRDHNREGHATYLLGERNTTGFWYFFPVVLGVKTPLALLALLATAWLLPAANRLWSRRALPVAAFAAGILLVGMASRINIGVRHILPIYIAFSILGAVALSRWFALSDARPWLAALPAVLLLWFAASSLFSHPDYIPYFNELAGSHPENIVVDSDLDWGQDLKRLGTRLSEAHAPELTYNQFNTGDLEHEHGFPPIREMNLAAPSPGWNAADLTYLKERRLGLYNAYPNVRLWPDYIPPTEMVGHSIRLWYFPYPGDRRQSAP